MLQLEYTVLGQYAGQFRRIPSILFEHDVYFQSIARRLPFMTGIVERTQGALGISARAALRLRLLPQLDRIQVCSRDNAEYLLSFLPQLKGRIDDGYRAGIDTSRYEFRPTGASRSRMLFLGSFRHLPNHGGAALVRAGRFLPRVRAEEPRARLVVVGSDPPPRHSLAATPRRSS